MFTTPNPEIARIFPKWDYLRARQVYHRKLTEDEKGFIGTIRLFFFDKKPWSLYAIELFNSKTHESITLTSTERFYSFVIDELGMDPVDARDLHYYVDHGFLDGSKEWHWYPWPPKNVDEFLASIKKKTSQRS